MNTEILSNLDFIFNEVEIIDLSHKLVEGIPKFPTHSSYRHIAHEHVDDPATMYRLEIHEHSGTHVDAPIHYLADISNFKGDVPTTDGISLNHLIGLATVISVSKQPGELVSMQDLTNWMHISKQKIDTKIVLFNFSWHKKWKLFDEEYASGWPGISPEVANYLLEQNVKVVGTDCLGMDSHNSKFYPAHDTFLKNNILIIENLNFKENLPTKIFFLALPLNINGGSGSPIRAVAFTERKK